MIPSCHDESMCRSWYFDKRNPIHKGNAGKLSKRSFRAMKRVSPYPLEFKYTPILNELERSFIVSLESGKKLETQELMEVLSDQSIDWSKALKLFQEGGDPFAYKGDAFRPNVLFKVIVDITNAPKSQAENTFENERIEFIELLLEKEGIESLLLQCDSTPFENTPFTAAIAARDKRVSKAIFNHLKKTNHELLITPNHKTLPRHFGNNTPLVLSIKTNNEDLAIDLVPFYNAELLRKPITWANSNALELAHLARFNNLLPVMAISAQGFSPDEATKLQKLYDGCPRGTDVWYDLYETDMFLNDEGEFIEDRERISNSQAYHTENFTHAR
ncbi:hypothetical protein [Endozoicomonas sp. 4G]|uniref:hypothetical protein n=1 Tax=Endozoicomonas sp. 4G TaxID=2872754 RepID=UPI00207862ED|nr:hypothetical protein [Endozoicomonas sp. 4G]